MHRFDDVSELETVLERQTELVTRLPRRPGEKEARYAHLLSGMPAAEDAESQAPAPARTDRIGALEGEVARLRSELEELKQQFAGFQKQFE